MPDYDPKNIPVLDDIIDDEIEDDSKAATTHEKIIISAEINVDENSLDLFSGATADIEIDSAEPEIGIIDQVIDDDIDLEIEAHETQDDRNDNVESALINYSFECNAEDDASTDVQAEGEIHPADEQSNQQAAFIEQPATTDPAITLDSVVDDIVTQVMPDLELQLHSLIQKALREKLPEDLIRRISAEDDD